MTALSLLVGSNQIMPGQLQLLPDYSAWNAISSCATAVCWPNQIPASEVTSWSTDFPAQPSTRREPFLVARHFRSYFVVQGFEAVITMQQNRGKRPIPQNGCVLARCGSVCQWRRSLKKSTRRLAAKHWSTRWLRSCRKQD